MNEHSLTNFHAARQRSDNYKVRFEVAGITDSDKSGGRMLKESVLSKYKSITDLPEGVSLSEIKLVEKPMAAYDDYIYVIYKCKDSNCKTIFTKQNLDDMQRFTDTITADPIWAQFCVREVNQPYFDGFGCTRNAYNNLTRYITANLAENAT